MTDSALAILWSKGNQDKQAGPGSDIRVSIKSLTVTVSPQDLKMFSCNRNIFEIL